MHLHQLSTMQGNEEEINTLAAEAWKAQINEKRIRKFALIATSTVMAVIIFLCCFFGGGDDAELAVNLNEKQQLFRRTIQLNDGNDSHGYDSSHHYYKPVLSRFLQFTNHGADDDTDSGHEKRLFSRTLQDKDGEDHCDHDIPGDCSHDPH